MATAAPVIDLDSPDAPELLRAACEQSGFAVIAGHGVPTAVMDAHRDAQRRFFALPMEVKRTLLATKDPNNRGYSPPNEQALDPSGKPDTKEGYYVGREEPAGGTPLQGPNNWPDEALVPGFRSAMLDYHAAMLALGDRVLAALAVSLGLHPAHFTPLFDRSIATLRPLHYGAQDDPGAVGAGAHTDFGCITLLLTDDAPGLQLFLGGRWVDVPPRPDCFIMNIGDMLERWTNGLFKSTLHRVLNTGQERYSTAFFIDANYDALIECVSTCCGPDNPPKYPPVLAGEWLTGRLKATHTQHALDSAVTA